MHQIRSAQPSDVSTILRFIRELAEFEKLAHMVATTEEILSNSLFGNDAKAYCLIAEHEGEAAGFCIYFYNFSTFLGRPGIYIEDIYVTPSHRSAGLGRRFFEYLAAKATAEQCGRLEWWVLDWNQRAIDFYKRLGAEPMDEWTVYRISGDGLTNLATSKEENAA